MNKDKSKKTMLLVALILVVILATIITRFFTKDRTWPIKAETSSSTEIVIPENWLSGESEGFIFKYPENFGTKYINPVDWPIKINISKQAFSCLEAGNEISLAGETKLESVGNREYCVTRESEGAAGSIYTNYAYAFPYNNETLIMTFSSRATQCMNYDNPEQAECLTERESFNITPLVDKIASTIKSSN
ncbi:hypothetical protein SDC9_21678 [bioreactor metagenome]|uniref:Uncharacterized protein n=1 Tax=bioreactor metagenome TaxID=1076179 RepID=A0A644UAF2_9ZZZZ|nr:hypothetical protein [Candidatus Elulimicrobiales bacterium]